MPYWLTNPEHGVMPVYDRSEVQRHEKFGWSLLNEGSSPVRPEPERDKHLDAPEKRKPGRPPKAK